MFNADETNRDDTRPTAEGTLTIAVRGEPVEPTPRPPVAIYVFIVATLT